MSSPDEQKAQDLAKAIAALGEVFIGRIPVTLSGMEDELHTIQKDPQNQAAWKTLHRHLHSLAGSAGTFGHAELGDRARELEHRINDVLKSGAEIGEAFRLQFIQDQRAFMRWTADNFVKK